MSSDFVSCITTALSENKIELIMSIIKDRNHLEDIRTHAWDLIPVMTPYLHDKVRKENGELHAHSKKLLDLIINEMTPEEAALQIVGEASSIKDDTAFVCFLQVFEKILPRISSKRLSSLAWAFSAISGYLEEINPPESQNLNLEEQMLMDGDPVVHRICILYSEVLSFLDVFMRKKVVLEPAAAAYRTSILNKFVIDLLGTPMAHLDMEEIKGLKSRARSIGEKLVQTHFSLCGDPLHLLEKLERPPEETPGRLAQADFFYLIFGEQVSLELIPKVYNPIYVFHNCLSLVCTLLDSADRALRTKGLKLSNGLLNNLTGFELPYDLLDSEYHPKFCKLLANMVIYDVSDRHRKLGLSIFQMYLNSFEIRGRYLIIYNLTKCVNHGGFVGYLITQYKDLLDIHIEEKDTSCYFTGQNLLSMLGIFCYLHRAAESDLIEISDQIVAALNLLRYLAIRDTENVTGIWDHFKELERGYLEPLRKGLEMSKAHYELKLKELREGISAAKTKEEREQVNIIVAGEKLPEMPTTEKLKVITSALTTFDVMESLMGRLTELIESNSK